MSNHRHLKNFLTFEPNKAIINFHSWGVHIVENEVAYFDSEEMAFISRILRGAFDIRTANDEEDNTLADFIQALDDGATIKLDEGD